MGCCLCDPFASFLQDKKWVFVGFCFYAKNLLTFFLLGLGLMEEGEGEGEGTKFEMD